MGDADRNARPDFKALKLVASLRNFNDDGLLKAIAGAFEAEGVRIIASTEFLREVLAVPGPLTRRALSPDDERDLSLDGFLCFTDPAKADVQESLARLARLAVCRNPENSTRRHCGN